MSETGEKKYYCFCSSNCKYETMTKEQILAAIAQAVETGRVGDCDTGFVTKLKETNSGSYVKMWVGTRAQYNALQRPENNCMYIITDDTSKADLLATVQQTADSARQSAEEAAAAAAAAEIAKRGSIVEFHTEMTEDGVRHATDYVLYENGFAEGWYRWVIKNVKFTQERGGFYLTETISLPHPQWYKDLNVDVYPIACDITPYDGLDTWDSYFVLSSTYQADPAEYTRSFQIACTAPDDEQYMSVVVHYVFRWKEA